MSGYFRYPVLLPSGHLRVSLSGTAFAQWRRGEIPNRDCVYQPLWHQDLIDYDLYEAEFERWIEDWRKHGCHYEDKSE